MPTTTKSSKQSKRNTVARKSNTSTKTRAASKPATRKQQRSKPRPTRASEQKNEQTRTLRQVLVLAKLDPTTKLGPEQRKRALEAQKTHAGLRGKSLATFILDGLNGKQQIDDARKSNELKRDVQRKSSRSKKAKGDTEAAELIAVVLELKPPELKGRYRPAAGREFLDTFKVAQRRGKIVVTRDDVNAKESFDPKELEAFAVKGAKNSDVRSQLATLGKGHKRMYGRKLALLIIASAR